MCLLVVPFQVAAQGSNIELLVTLQYDVPGYVTNAVYTRPSFEVMRQEIMKRYGGQYNVSVRYFQHKDHRTCEDVTADAVDDISEYLFLHRRNDTCYAIVESGCNEQNGLSNLAAQLDVLVFTLNMDSMIKDFLTPKSEPQTTVSLGVSSISFSVALLDLLNQHRWYHVTTLVEISKNITAFYSLMETSLIDLTKRTGLPFQLTSRIINNVMSEREISAILRDLKRQGRVFVLYMTAVLALRVLALTEELDMNNGEYVFINSQPIPTPTYGVPAQFTQPVNGIKNLNAFRSLIMLLPATKPPTATIMPEVNAKIANITLAQFNYTYANGIAPLDTGFAGRTALEMLEVFSTVAVESDSDQQKAHPVSFKTQCSGHDLVDRLSNRVFSLRSGKLYFSASGIRLLNTDVFAFNTSTFALQTIGIYDSTEKRMLFIANRSIPWPTPNGLQPPDVPECGFAGDEGPCAEKKVLERTSAIGGMVACMVACIAVLAVCAALRQWHIRNATEVVNYWILDPELLHYLTRHFSVAPLSYHED
ncbi:hypothetical protein BV898_14682 [Hypsibius exemplaris]|uniref:Receptor ligand binding region domain-containing protein n=1 Tax=Hypsibius exemplaris TaxID=2072580 RepID=A0A9X6N9D0_HYPEX|nr:hypothetical protein BV898_14682 [Hypsibius exemplaris]